MSRRVLTFVLGLAFALASSVACERPSQVVIRNVIAYRGADNRVIVDVELEGVEQSGRAVGPYCVSVHWFVAGLDPGAFEPQLRYFGEIDHATQCASDLGDGDRRTMRFVSNETSLLRGAPARVQVRHAGIIDITGVAAP